VEVDVMAKPQSPFAFAPYAGARACSLHFCALFSLLLLVAVAGVHEVADGDIGFHLSAGRYLFEHGSLPSEDFLAHTTAGTQWMVFEWLYSAFAYFLWHEGGSALLILGHAAVNVLAFGALAWLLHRHEPRQILIYVLLLCAFLVAEVRFSVRPHAFERLFLATSLLLLAEGRVGQRWCWWLLVPLQVVWANTHGSYLLGLLLAAVVFLDEAALRRKPFQAIGVFLAMAAASLFTPYGFRQTLHLVAHRQALLGVATNPEWMPLRLGLPVLVDPAIWAVFLLTLLSAVVLWQRRAGLLEGAFWALALAAPFLHARMLPASAMVLAAVPAFAALRREPGPRSRRDLDWYPAVPAIAASLCLALLFLTNIYPTRFNRPARCGLLVSSRAPGWGAGSYLAQFSDIETIFNSYRLGGWLGWWLAPQGGRVFIDGRDVGNVFSPVVFAEYLRLSGDPAAFEKEAAEKGWDAAVLEHGDPLSARLLAALGASTTWEIGYMDEVSVVFLRAGRLARVVDFHAFGIPKRPTAYRGIDRLAASGRLTASPRGDVSRASRWARAMASVGHADLAAEGYRQSLAENPRDAEALAFLGTRELVEGNYREAMELLGRAVDVRPGFAPARLNLALACFHRGDVQSAIAHGRAAARWQPHDPTTWSNLAQFYLAAGQPDEAARCHQRLERLQLRLGNR